MKQKPLMFSFLLSNSYDPFQVFNGFVKSLQQKVYMRSVKH